ncbi:MAG: class I SAM-dependent methyltransferase [Alphaproteobacteria bacterium]
MSGTSGDARNADQIAFWNESGGARWAKHQETLDVVLAPLAEGLLARAAVKPGERVVDIGCGCGATTLLLARAVGPAGHVLGIDVSVPMLARAAGRLPKDGPVELVRADATTYGFPRASFDLLCSRLGVMFFAEPARAFANLRSALKPSGRLRFVAFRAARENPWMMVPLHAAYEHVPRLPQLGPEEPGPFAFASEARVRGILGAAGFAQIELEPYDLELDIAAGRGLEAAVAAALEIGATSRAIAGQPPEIRHAVAQSIRAALEPCQRGSAVPLPAAVWFASAAKG